MTVTTVPAAPGRLAAPEAGTVADLWNAIEPRQPERTALVAGTRRLSYRVVGEQIRGLAASLSARWAVEPGEPVALLAPNCPAFVVAYFAVLSVGGVVQPIDERLTAAEVAATLRDSGARRLIVHGALWSRWLAARIELTTLPDVLGIELDAEGVARFEDWTAGAPGAPRPAAPGSGDAAELMYTSGTAGRPKAALRSHANVRAAALNSIRGFGYREDDVIAIVMPLSHSSALVSQMLPVLQLGGTLVLVERFEPTPFVALLAAEGVTCMRAVPAMLRALLAVAGFTGEALPRLTRLVNSSAPLDPATYHALAARFPRLAVMNSYGLTEASTCTILDAAAGRRHPDSVGAPIEGVRMRVVGEGGGDLGPGEVGEILVAGPHVFLGYRDRPDATAAVLRDGWLSTGDLGRRDEEGLYYLEGRRDDVINCGGRKVWPLEVEHCILELPEVAEVAVVAAPHRVLGEVVRAVVVVRPGHDLPSKRLVGHCARRLASHKVPFVVDFARSLPRNSVGKTVRRALRDKESAR